MAGYNDPKLLYAISGINAYHIENGKEESLTPSGPQTLSLLMVPTSPPPALITLDEAQPPEEDFYLHLHLPPELDLPLPATTQIYFQPPSSYLIPRAWDLGADRGAFTRLEFPGIGSGGSQEDVDTFETIMAQCTAFLERAPPPKPPRSKDKETQRSKVKGVEAVPAYDPSAFKPGEGYVRGSASSSEGKETAHGQIVLVDEEDGSVVGELGEGFHVVEDSKLKAGSKDPVVITLPEDGSLTIGVAPASATSIERAIHPAYKNSTLVNKAAMASRLIVTSSDYVSKTLQTQANNFTQNTKPNSKPMTFTPTVHRRIRKVHGFSSGTVGVSAKVIGHVSKYAESLGASIAKRAAGKPTIGPDGQPVPYEPGLLNKSLMAFSTLVDGVDQAGRGLLESSTNAATTVVAHRYGDEAGEVTRHLGGNVKNVALVYIDATGVSRKAIVKSVLKGMVVGMVSDGSKLVVPGTEDGGAVSPPPGPAEKGKGKGNGSGGVPGVARAGSVPSALDKKKNWKEREAAEGRYTDDGPGGKKGEKALPPPPPYRSSSSGSGGGGGGKTVDEYGFPQDSKDQWHY